MATLLPLFIDGTWRSGDAFTFLRRPPGPRHYFYRYSPTAGMSTERDSGDDVPLEGERKARFEEVRNSIARRLRKACGHLPPEEFDALVDKMTRVQIGKRYQ